LELEKVLLVIADEILSLVPVVGPLKDAKRAAEDGQLGEYCFHLVMLICDVTPMALASEAARMTKATSEIAKLVRKGKKGYSLRKVAATAKRLSKRSKDARKAEELTDGVRMVLRMIPKICERLQKEEPAKIQETEKQ
jgi:hypothetical protein